MFGRFEHFIFFGVFLFNLSKPMSISLCTTLSSPFTKSTSHAHKTICYNFLNLHIFTLWCQVCKISIISFLTISWCCLSVSQKSPFNTMFMLFIIVCLIWFLNVAIVGWEHMIECTIFGHSCSPKRGPRIPMRCCFQIENDWDVKNMCDKV